MSSRGLRQWLLCATLVTAGACKEPPPATLPPPPPAAEVALDELSVKTFVPAQLRLEPAAGTEIATQAVNAGALSAEAHVWVHPTHPTTRVVVTRAKTLLPENTHGTPVREALSVFLHDSLENVAGHGTKQVGLKQRWLPAGLEYSHGAMLSGVEVHTRGVAAIVEAPRGPQLWHATVMCTCTAEDHATCVRALEAATFSPPEAKPVEQVLP